MEALPQPSTALEELVPNFSGNEFAYGQQHIVFWLSAIVTAIDSASWPVGQFEPIGPTCAQEGVSVLLVYLSNAYKRRVAIYVCSASCEVAN